MLLPSGRRRSWTTASRGSRPARFRPLEDRRVRGTPLYAAPEQASTGKVDARTDVSPWGRSPHPARRPPAFAARSIPEIVGAVLHHDPPPPSRVVPGIPVYLDRVIGRPWRRSPHHRTRGADPRRRSGGRARGPAAVACGRSRRDRRRRHLAPSSRDRAAIEPIEIELVEARGTRSRRPFTRWWQGVPGPPAAAVARPSGDRGALGPPRPFPRCASRPSSARRLVGRLAVAGGFEIGYVVLRFREAPAGTPAPTAPPTLMAPLPEVLCRPASVAAEPTPVAAQPDAQARRALGPRFSPRPTGPSRRIGRAGLRIDFDHPLKAGVLRVWVDGHAGAPREDQRHRPKEGRRLQVGPRQSSVTLSR